MLLQMPCLSACSCCGTLQAALISEEVAERQTSLADITKQVLPPAHRGSAAQTTCSQQLQHLTNPAPASHSDALLLHAS
jgi:hypothetical protein